MVAPSISFENVDLDKEAVDGPISVRSTTDLGAGYDRSRCGVRPISATLEADVGSRRTKDEGHGEPGTGHNEPVDSSAPDPLARLLAAPPRLPAREALPRLRELLADDPGHGIVVTAPPGTGKTTLVPPLVAHALTTPEDGGRVIVTQPRRIAARAAARRLADLLDEPLGNTVGYAVRGEREAGPHTRIEVVTAGLLLRRLQADPDLPGVAAVVLDEVHERSLESDLLLTLLLDARALREDLVIIAMSATADLDRLPTMLGAGSPDAAAADSAADGGNSTDGPGLAPEAPIVSVTGSLHPLQEVWAPPPSRTPRLGPHGVPREFLAHVAATAQRALTERTGDALVFLPGAREVEDVVSRLHGSVPESVDVLPLHGRLSARAQDAALAPSPPGHRRVVVATNVAESSLTVPGVRVVVDAMLTRQPRLDVARGMSGLVTVGASRAEGVQRAGRAGREGPGVVYRCCTPTDWARAPQAPVPEILSADLTRLVLELAVWGAPDGAGLTWLDPPPAPAMEAARGALQRLGLLEGDAGADGTAPAVTPLGRAVARIPADARLARALLTARGTVGARRAAEGTALLSAELRAPGGDLTALARSVHDDGASASAWRAEARRLERAAESAGRILDQARRAAGSVPSAGAAPTDGPQTPAGSAPAAATPTTPLSEAVALVAALARPEWIARRRGPTPSAGEPAFYTSVGGAGMRTARESALSSSPWLAVADVDAALGRGDASVRAAAPIDDELALSVGAPWLIEEERVVWAQGRLRSERLRRLGAITLTATPGGTPPPSAVAGAVVEACRAEGLDVLPWNEAGELRARLALLHRELDEPWPAMDDDALLARAGLWLVPAVEALAARGRRFDLGRLDVGAALRALLPWPEAAGLDDLAPERIEVPSGSRVRASYVGEQGEMLQRPILAVRLQECFGWADTPRVVDGRVPVLIHLLSPARRPVAVTDDLRSFWAGPYRQVRAELRGRYPKHPWPEDPWTAPATRGTRRRG